MHTEHSDEPRHRAAPRHAAELPPPAPANRRQRRLDTMQAYSEVVIAIAVVLTICYFAKLVLITLFTSILLAFMLQPVVDLADRIRLPRPVGSALAVLLLVGVFYGILYFSYNRGVEFVRQLPQYTEKIREHVMKFRQQAEKFQKTTEQVLPETQEERQTVKVQQQVSWPELLTRSAGTVWEFVLIISFIPFLIYFMLTWQDHVRAATVMLFRMEHRNTAYVTLGRIASMIRHFIVGNVVIGVFMGVVSTAAFGVIQLPYFYFLGFISGFLSLVPYLGVVLALLPPLVAAVGQLTGAKVIVIVATVIGLHLFAINVLYPKLLGRRVQLNPLVVTIALMIWGWLWGGMGLILAVPVTAAIKIIFDHVESLRPYGNWLGE